MYLVFCSLRNKNNFHTTFEHQTCWMWLFWFSYRSFFAYHCA